MDNEEFAFDDPTKGRAELASWSIEQREVVKQAIDLLPEEEFLETLMLTTNLCSGVDCFIGALYYKVQKRKDFNWEPAGIVTDSINREYGFPDDAAGLIYWGVLNRSQRAYIEERIADRLSRIVEGRGRRPKARS